MDNDLNPHDAVRILMLSPLYRALAPKARRELVREYCAGYAEAAGLVRGSKKKESGSEKSDQA